MQKSFPESLIDLYFAELSRLGYKPGIISKTTGIDRTTLFRIKKHERFPTKNMWLKLFKPFEFQLAVVLRKKYSLDKEK